MENSTEEMGMTALCDLPEDEAIAPEEFVKRTEHVVEVAAKYMSQESLNIEMASFDLVKVIFDSEGSYVTQHETRSCGIKDRLCWRCL